eukprot:jgi/Bigna1/86681/estExt_fgenesh1_pg.C_120249
MYGSTADSKTLANQAGDSLEAFLRSEKLGSYTAKLRDLEITLELLLELKEWGPIKDTGLSVGMKLNEIMRLFLALKKYPDESGEEDFDTDDNDEISPSSSKACCGGNWLYIYTSYLMKPLDMILPFDHRTEFRQKILRAHDGAKIKQIFTQVCELWILTFSLIFNTVVGLWGLIPDETSSSMTDTERLCWEICCLLACTTSLGVVISMCLFSLNISLCSNSNVKSYLVITSGAWAFAENSILIATYSTFLSVVFLGYTRIREVVPPASYAAQFVVPICFIVYMMLMIMCVNYISYASVHGGLMHKTRVARNLKNYRRQISQKSVQVEEHAVKAAVIEQFRKYYD